MKSFIKMLRHNHSYNINRQGVKQIDPREPVYFVPENEMEIAPEPQKLEVLRPEKKKAPPKSKYQRS